MNDYDIDDDDLDFDLPFLTLASAGGPHDDESYLAGFEMGTLYTFLATCALNRATPDPMAISRANRRQAELIASRRGMVMVVTHDEPDEPELLGVEFRYR